MGFAAIIWAMQRAAPSAGFFTKPVIFSLQCSQSIQAKRQPSSASEGLCDFDSSVWSSRPLVVIIPHDLPCLFKFISFHFLRHPFLFFFCSSFFLNFFRHPHFVRRLTSLRSSFLYHSFATCVRKGRAKRSQTTNEVRMSK